MPQDIELAHPIVNTFVLQAIGKNHVILTIDTAYSRGISS